MRLNIGGIEPKAGWTILNVKADLYVDLVGECTNLSMIPDASVEEVYASHVLEHLNYDVDLTRALREIFRVLKPGGRVMISVPDLATLCWMFTMPNMSIQDRYQLMSIMFGGQKDAYDLHRCGMNHELLGAALNDVGFGAISRVENFGLFNDCSVMLVFGIPISLNMEARKLG